LLGAGSGIVDVDVFGWTGTGRGTDCDFGSEGDGGAASIGAFAIDFVVGGDSAGATRAVNVGGTAAAM